MPFNPAAIAGLVEHWNPDDISGADGDAIGTWTGAVNSLVLSGPGGGNDPVLMDATRHASGKQGVLFSATNRAFSITDAALDNAQCTYMFVACWYHLSGGNQWLINKLNTNAATVGIRLTSGSTQGTVRLDGSEGTSRNATASAVNRTNAPHVFTLRYNGTRLIVRVDGVEVAGLNTTGSIDTDNSGALAIGNHPTVPSTTYAWFGDIAIWDNAISDSEMATAETDLMADWGIGDYNAAWTTGSRSIVLAPAAGEDQFFSPQIISDGSTLYMFFAVHETAGVWRWIDYATSADNGATWTRNAGSPIIDSDVDSPSNCRGVGVAIDGTTWHLLVDSAVDGIYHFTGTDLTALTDNGQVYTGHGTGNLEFARHPCILPYKVGGNWRVFFDGRAGTWSSEFGAVGMVDTADFAIWGTAVEVMNSESWWWTATDVGAPSVKVINGTVAGLFAGYNDALLNTQFPHWIGAAKSTDNGATWTYLPEHVPVLSGNETATVGVESPEWFDDGTDQWIYFVSKTVTAASIAKVKVGSDLLAFLEPATGGNPHLLHTRSLLRGMAF